MKGWPIFASIVAFICVLTMIGLGVWQLQRKEQKEALLTGFQAARDMPAIAWPVVPIPDDLPLYRKSSVTCLKPVAWRAISGKNRAGQSGFAHIADCQTMGGEGPGARIAVGWSNRPASPNWSGGTVSGVIAPDGEKLIRLVSVDKVEGLEILAKPTTDNIPNNHLSYAVQWFFFALIAAIIFVLAVRRKKSTVEV